MPHHHEVLIEIKNIHDGVAQYTHARSVSFRCGGVVRRASEVDREYHVSAMHLDHTHHGVQLQTVQRRLAPVGGPGPVERVLGSYPPVRGAAFGPRADASGDVDSLLRFAAGW